MTFNLSQENQTTKKKSECIFENIFKRINLKFRNTHNLFITLTLNNNLLLPKPIFANNTAKDGLLTFFTCNSSTQEEVWFVCDICRHQYIVQ